MTDEERKAVDLAAIKKRRGFITEGDVTGFDSAELMDYDDCGEPHDEIAYTKQMDGESASKLTDEEMGKIDLALEYRRQNGLNTPMDIWTGQLLAKVRRLKAENEVLRTVELRLVMEQADLDDPDAAVRVMQDALNRRQIRVPMKTLTEVPLVTAIEELPREEG